VFFPDQENFVFPSDTLNKSSEVWKRWLDVDALATYK
jgi:hypothetical protein